MFYLDPFIVWKLQSEAMQNREMTEPNPAWILVATYSTADCYEQVNLSCQNMLSYLRQHDYWQ